MNHSEWAAERFGQLCIAYLMLRSEPDVWPNACCDRRALQADIAHLAYIHRHDTDFFHYLIGMTGAGDRPNGLGGRGIALLDSVLGHADFGGTLRPPKTFLDWRVLAEALGRWASLDAAPAPMAA